MAQGGKSSLIGEAKQLELLPERRVTPVKQLSFIGVVSATGRVVLSFILPFQQPPSIESIEAHGVEVKCSRIDYMNSGDP